MKLYYITAKKASLFLRDAAKKHDGLSQSYDRDSWMYRGRNFGCRGGQALLGDRKCPFFKKFSCRGAESVQISIVLRRRICYNKQK